MTTTLVLTSEIADAFLAAARERVETAAVLLARAVTTASRQLRLLARSVIWVPDAAYAVRESASLVISSDGYVPALGEAERTACVPIWVHTHPGDGASPAPSRHDLVVDEQLSDLFRLRSGSKYYGSLIIAHDAGTLKFSGHVDTESRRSTLDRIWTVGRRLALACGSEPLSAIPRSFDRNVRAFGGEVQRTLGQLHVAIVGCGGTGSAVAEQLVRLGVRTFSLFDPDTLSDTNITRVYGSTDNDVGRPKVGVLADHLRRIAPQANIAVFPSMITMERTARALTDADVIFGCTDDNAGRLVLSRLSTYFLTPVIDSGVLIATEKDGKLHGIYGRVTVLYPGAGCLICRKRVDTERARTELLTPVERVRLQNEGYAPALGGIEPAVVAYTSMVASTAVAELLERLVQYGPVPTPNEVLLRLHDREISTNIATPKKRHYCDPASGKQGLGITQPFLEMTWPG